MTMSNKEFKAWVDSMEEHAHEIENDEIENIVPLIKLHDSDWKAPSASPSLRDCVWAVFITLFLVIAAYILMAGALPHE